MEITSEIKRIFPRWRASYLAAFAFVIQVLLNLSIKVPDFLGISLIVWLAIALLVTEIFTLNDEITKMKTTKPNIVAEPVKMEKPFPIKSIERVPFGETIVRFTDTIVERYYLVLRNKQANGINLVDATQIHARILFYDNDCNFLESYSHEFPFWLNSLPPYQRNPRDPQITLEASEKPQGLHLLIRKQGTRELYIFGDHSYDLSRGSLDPFQEELKLLEDKYYICVQITATNIVKNQCMDFCY